MTKEDIDIGFHRGIDILNEFQVPDLLNYFIQVSDKTHRPENLNHLAGISDGVFTLEQRNSALIVTEQSLGPICAVQAYFVPLYSSPTIEFGRKGDNFPDDLLYLRSNPGGRRSAADFVTTCILASEEECIKIGPKSRSIDMRIAYCRFARKL